MERQSRIAIFSLSMLVCLSPLSKKAVRGQQNMSELSPRELRRAIAIRARPCAGLGPAGESRSLGLRRGRKSHHIRKPDQRGHDRRARVDVFRGDEVHGADTRARGCRRCSVPNVRSSGNSPAMLPLSFDGTTESQRHLYGYAGRAWRAMRSVSWARGRAREVGRRKAHPQSRAFKPGGTQRTVRSVPPPGQ